MSFRSWVKLAGHVMAALALTGCTNQPKPPPPPLIGAGAAVSHVDQFAGSALSGPVAKRVDAVDADEALWFDVTLTAVEHIAAAEAPPIGSSARLVIATRNAAPVRPSARLSRSAGFAGEKDAAKIAKALSSGACGRTVELGHYQAIVAPETTTSAESSDPGPARGTLNFVRRLRIEVTMPRKAAAGSPAAADLALALDDLGAPEKSEDSNSPAASAAKPLPQQETVLLDSLAITKSTTVAFTVPFHFTAGLNDGLVAVVKLSRASSNDAAQKKACDVATANLKKSFNEAGQRDTSSADAGTVFGAVEGMSQPASRRSAIVFLAGWSGAGLCDDVALSADEATLARLAEGVIAALAKTPADKLNVAWRMDKAALDLIARLQTDNKLPSELSALLSDRMGEAGRHASAIEEIEKELQGPADLWQRVVATNYLYLEDTSPAARSRAYEWLLARKQAPAGFDPMGPAKARRAALEKAAANRSATTLPTGAP